MKKTKEMNLTYNSKDLQENIKEIMATSQRLTQTRTEVQHNMNEIVKLKNNIQQVCFVFKLFFPLMSLCF